MNKKFCITISILFLLMLQATAFASTKIIFATQDFFPFSYENKGEVLGPGAEIIRTVCDRISEDYEIKIFPWRRSQAMIKKGQVQALFMVGKNKERESWLNFSPPIISTEYGLFQCSEKPINFSGTGSLTNKTIGVYGPSNTSHQLYKISRSTGWNMTIDLTPDYITQFRKLSRRRVDAVYFNKDAGLAAIGMIKATNIDYAGPDKKLNYYIAFSKKFAPATFIQKFNEQIRKMKANGELMTILSKYGLEVAK